MIMVHQGYRLRIVLCSQWVTPDRRELLIPTVGKKKLSIPATSKCGRTRWNEKPTVLHTVYTHPLLTTIHASVVFSQEARKIKHLIPDVTRYSANSFSPPIRRSILTQFACVLKTSSSDLLFLQTFSLSSLMREYSRALLSTTFFTPLNFSIDILRFVNLW